MGTVSSLVWITLFCAGLFAEGVFLLNKKNGDTLSEKVWLLRLIPQVRMVLAPFWAWMTWHFFLEPESIDVDSGVWWDDILLIITISIVSLYAKYTPHKKD